MSVLNQMLDCIIVDDDPLAVRMMQSLVEKTDFLNLIDSFNSSVQASALLRSQKIDLVFLDIEMPEMTGLELIKTIKGKPEIILISSKKEYGQDAFEYQVTDYLVKPLNNYARYLQAVLKAKGNIESRKSTVDSSPQQLFIKADSLLTSIQLKDIFWISAYGDFVKIHTAQKLHTVLSKLQTLCDKLPAEDFIRVHRSYVVRLDKITNIDYQANNLEICNEIIPIGRSFKNHLMERIKLL